MGNKQYCVYILTNSRHSDLYTGVTNNLERRLSEHKSKTGNGFTKRYNVDQLVYYECGDDINITIAREKQIEAGLRQDKIDLINSINPDLNGKIYQKNSGVSFTPAPLPVRVARAAFFRPWHSQRGGFLG